MDIEVEQLRRGINVAVSLDASDVTGQVPDGVRVSDGRSEFVLRVKDGAGFHAVRTVAEFAATIERERSEQRRKALRDLDAAHKKARAQLRDERAHIAELEEQLRDERARADELERALNMVLHAARRAVRDAGLPVACCDEVRCRG